jgi:hypothetical protein
MIAELFLIAALSPRPMSVAHAGTRAAINAYHLMKSTDEEKLTRWIRKNNPDAEVFITPRGDAEKLKEHGWERLPFSWNNKEIWIKRKPKSDQTPNKRLIEASA